MTYSRSSIDGAREQDLPLRIRWKITVYILMPAIFSCTSCMAGTFWRTIADYNGNDAFFEERHEIKLKSNSQEEENAITLEEVLKYPVVSNCYVRLQDGNIVSIDSGMAGSPMTRMSGPGGGSNPYFRGPSPMDWAERAAPENGIWRQVEIADRKIVLIKSVMGRSYWKARLLPDGYEVTTNSNHFEVKISGTRQAAGGIKSAVISAKKSQLDDFNKHMGVQRSPAAPSSMQSPVTAPGKPVDVAEMLGQPYCKIIFSPLAKAGASELATPVQTGEFEIESITRFTGSDDKVGVEIYNKRTPVDPSIRATPAPEKVLQSLCAGMRHELDSAFSSLVEIREHVAKTKSGKTILP